VKINGTPSRFGAIARDCTMCFNSYPESRLCRADRYALAITDGSVSCRTLAYNGDSVFIGNPLERKYTRDPSMLQRWVAKMES
jgi:hypothetical protein